MCMHENSLVSVGWEHMRENAFWDYKNKISWKVELDLVNGMNYEDIGKIWFGWVSLYIMNVWA
jgi:hypothetical protein